MKWFPSILAFVLAVCLHAHAAVFNLAAPSAIGSGTEATAAVLVDTATDKPDALSSIPATFTLSDQTVVTSTPTASVTSSTWKSNIGGIVAKCLTQTTPSGYVLAFTLTNGWTHRMEQADFRIPQIFTAADPANRVETPFRGGSATSLAMDWAKGQGNTGNWPGTAYSPLLTIWNDRTQDTLAITFFNKAMVPVFVYWFSGANGDGSQQSLTPILRCFPRLQPGQSVTIGADYRVTTGGPAAHAAYYRQNILTPFMKELGIPEAMAPLGDGPIAMTATGADHFAASVAAAQAGGASAYIQWAAPDGLAAYYNPYPPAFDWFQSIKPSTFPVGVMINPFISPRIATDSVALTDSGRPMINLHLNLAAPDTRLYLARLRDELVKRGVTLAFWDTGGEPDACGGHEWLKVLSGWKQAGIAIMPESSCDVAAWTTGLWMEYPYSWGDYALPRVVTPQATLAAHTNTVDVRGGIDWKDDAKAKGVRPIIDVAELGGGK
jgi:hypothetical protein